MSISREQAEAMRQEVNEATSDHPGLDISMPCGDAILVIGCLQDVSKRTKRPCIREGSVRLATVLIKAVARGDSRVTTLLERGFDKRFDVG